MLILCVHARCTVYFPHITVIQTLKSKRSTLFRMNVFVCSGRAIQHVKQNIFTTEAGVRRGVPKVLVVLTDGRSQDDVNKVSKEMQMEGQMEALTDERLQHNHFIYMKNNYIK